MRNKKVTQKDILFLSISLFVIVVVWVAFNIYHTIVTTTISEDLQLQLTPIEGRFDTSTIEQLKSRTKVAPLLDSSSVTPASEEAEIEPAPDDTIIDIEEDSDTSEQVSPTGQPPLTEEEPDLADEVFIEEEPTPTP